MTTVFRPRIEITDAQKKMLKLLAKKRQVDEKKLLGQMLGNALLRECLCVNS